eukprot:PhM_4_TR10459/c0_g1_i1/m.85422
MIDLRVNVGATSTPTHTLKRNNSNDSFVAFVSPSSISQRPTAHRRASQNMATLSPAGSVGAAEPAVPRHREPSTLSLCGSWTPHEMRRPSMYTMMSRKDSSPSSRKFQRQKSFMRRSSRRATRRMSSKAWSLEVSESLWQEICRRGGGAVPGMVVRFPGAASLASLPSECVENVFMLARVQLSFLVVPIARFYLWKRWKRNMATRSITLSNPAALPQQCLRVVKRSEILHTWPLAVLTWMCERAVGRSYAEGNVIVHPGEPATCGVVLLLEGTARRWCGETHSQAHEVTLRQGSCHVDWFVLCGEPRRHGVKALATCHVAFIPLPVVHEVMASLPSEFCQRLDAEAVDARLAYMAEYRRVDARVLQRCPLFDDWGPDDLAFATLMNFTPIAVRDEEEVLRAHDISEGVYFISSGCVEVAGKTLGPGGTFGEVSCVLRHRLTGGAVARGHTEMWYLSHQDLTRGVYRDSRLKAAVLGSAKRMRVAELGPIPEQLRQRLARTVPLFASVLGPELTYEVLGLMEPVVFSCGDLVASSTEFCAEMFVFTKGRVAIRSSYSCFVELGEMIGFPLLVPHKWLYALYAEDLVEGYRLRRDTLVQHVMALPKGGGKALLSKLRHHSWVLLHPGKHPTPEARVIARSVGHLRTVMLYPTNLPRPALKLRAATGKDAATTTPVVTQPTPRMQSCVTSTGSVIHSHYKGRMIGFDWKVGDEGLAYYARPVQKSTPTSTLPPSPFSGVTVVPPHKPTQQSQRNVAPPNIDRDALRVAYQASAKLAARQRKPWMGSDPLAAPQQIAEYEFPLTPGSTDDLDATTTAGLINFIGNNNFGETFSGDFDFAALEENLRRSSVLDSSEDTPSARNMERLNEIVGVHHAAEKLLRGACPSTSNEAHSSKCGRFRNEIRQEQQQRLRRRCADSDGDDVSSHSPVSVPTPPTTGGRRGVGWAARRNSSLASSATASSAHTPTAMMMARTNTLSGMQRRGAASKPSCSKDNSSVPIITLNDDDNNVCHSAKQHGKDNGESERTDFAFIVPELVVCPSPDTEPPAVLKTVMTALGEKNMPPTYATPSK